MKAKPYIKIQGRGPFWVASIGRYFMDRNKRCFSGISSRRGATMAEAMNNLASEGFAQRMCSR